MVKILFWAAVSFEVVFIIAFLLTIVVGVAGSKDRTYNLDALAKLQAIPFVLLVAAAVAKYIF